MNLNLTELQRRLKSRSALALQMQSDEVVVSQVRADEGVVTVLRSFTLPFGADAIAANPDKAGSALAERLQSEGIREKRCVVCIPPGWALSTSTDVPEINPEDLRGYLELRAEREFPISISELRLSHCSYTLPDGKQRATIAAVPAKRLAAVEQMLERAGCRAVSMSLGLDRFVIPNEAPATLHFLANGTHVDVVITAGGGIAALRSLAGSVAQDEVAFDSANFCREVRITLGGLPEAVRDQVRKAHFGGPPKTAETLSLKTGDYLRRMGLDPAAIERETESGNPAFEAAAHFLKTEPVAFEFLPPQIPKWQVLLERFDDRRRKWLVPAAAAVIFLPIIAFMVHSHIESSLQQEWNGMKRNVSDLEVLQQNIRQYRPWFDSAPETLMILEGLMSAFPESGDVWAKTVQISEGQKVTCTGFARSHASLLALLDRFRARREVSEMQLQQERGESPIQFAVTFKWDANHGK